MLVTNVVCVVHYVAGGGYQFFIMMCAFSWIFPFLHDMATHGKTRDEAVTTTTAPNLDRILSAFLNQKSVLVPKTRFRHFYWAAFVWLVIVLSVAPSLGGGTQWFKLSTILLFCHILRRSYECMCVHRWRKASRMHIAGYLLGLLHYFLLPFTFVHLPGCRDATPSLQGSTTFMDPSYFYGGVSYVRSLYISIPVAVFSCWAQYQQHRHHVMLADLRRPTRKYEGSATGATYTLPVNGWFRSIVCPHYLAEILIYLSFDLLLSAEMQQLTYFWTGQHHWLLLWVTFNLVTSALMNLRWYQANITPVWLMEGKKAIFPGLL